MSVSCPSAMHPYATCLLPLSNTVATGVRLFMVNPLLNWFYFLIICVSNLITSNLYSPSSGHIGTLVNNLFLKTDLTGFSTSNIESLFMSLKPSENDESKILEKFYNDNKDNIDVLRWINKTRKTDEKYNQYFMYTQISTTAFGMCILFLSGSCNISSNNKELSYMITGVIGISNLIFYELSKDSKAQGLALGVIPVGIGAVASNYLLDCTTNLYSASYGLVILSIITTQIAASFIIHQMLDNKVESFPSQPNHV